MSKNHIDQEEDLSRLKIRSKKRKIEEISNSEESEPVSAQADQSNRSNKKKKQENPQKLDDVEVTIKGSTPQQIIQKTSPTQKPQAKPVQVQVNQALPKTTPKMSFAAMKMMKSQKSVSGTLENSDGYSLGKPARQDSSRIDITTSQFQVTTDSQVPPQTQYASQIPTATQYTQGLSTALETKNQQDIQIKKKTESLLINQLDKELVNKARENKQAKLIQAEQSRYIFFNNDLPKEWSLKNWLDISVTLKNEQDNLQLNHEELHGFLQYFVYSTDQKGFSFDPVQTSQQDKEFIKAQAKLLWLKSFRDVFRKYIHSKPSQSGEAFGQAAQMPFFYVRNNNFCCLFLRDEQGKCEVRLIPSKSLASVIQQQGILKVVTNICHDEQEQEEEQKKAREAAEAKMEEDDDEDHEDIAALLADQPEGRQTFNLIKKEETQLFTFRDKEVNSIFNVLLNYVVGLIENQVGVSVTLQSPAQIIAPSPFMNCTYNECQLFYNGRVQLANKQQKYQLKLSGVIFPHFLQSIASSIRRQVRTVTGDTEKEIEMNLRSDDQSRLFSHKKTLKTIKVSTKAGPQQSYRVIFQ